MFDVEVTGPVSFTATVRFGVEWTSDWLPLGTYTVTEVNAPVGHTIEPNPVTLDEDGGTVLVVVTNPTVLSEAPIGKDRHPEGRDRTERPERDVHLQDHRPGDRDGGRQGRHHVDVG